MAIMQPNLDGLVMFALDKLLQMASNCKCTSQPGTGITENAFSLSCSFFSFSFFFLIHFYTINMFPNPYYLKTTKDLKVCRE